MDKKVSARSQRTREQIRAAAQRLFLESGFMGTSTDAIMAEAGVASKETLYRHYANKEALFVDVLEHMTLEQARPAAVLADLPVPRDAPSLRLGLTIVAREILSVMVQPEYLALLRIIMAESPRFPHLGRLFKDAVPQRGLSIMTLLLQQAREQQVVDEVDKDAVSHALLGGLLTYALLDVFFVGQPAQPELLERADAVVEVIMRAVLPH
ncbi:transcriptional regulator [Dictyobacter alpinus]|uniref:Transcriptional regulator n=2 Tax=Dictyobacter alpinus TaxID=2014873 RepID=A0A402BBR3_9CHLR|nr:transcriptional regulator [Dictyobacter alpinus]